MKEDVLEQIVDDYLKLQGYFTMHNVPFRPRTDHPEYVSKKDSVPSDIDVIGINPRLRGAAKVVAVSCKAWQKGFNATNFLEQLRGQRPNPKRRRELQVRELWLPKWSEAFRAAVCERTGSSRFTYRLAVTKLLGDAEPWANDSTIKENLGGNPFEFLTLETMWSATLEGSTTRPAPSEIGRLAQLLKAANLQAPRLERE